MRKSILARRSKYDSEARVQLDKKTQINKTEQPREFATLPAPIEWEAQSDDGGHAHAVHVSFYKNDIFFAKAFMFLKSGLFLASNVLKAFLIILLNKCYINTL